ncbi:MAG TPA: thiamine pyrophosphate-binding protein [Caulobacteraceae bacterium]
MTGADYIAAFLARMGVKRVYTLTGGACAFMIDAVGRSPDLDYICMQHEQAAAMAADAVWRVSGRMGVTMATSGPGATNLLTGIACSFFDSIPTLHITGQVNQRESNAFLGTAVRQTGFQETKIVEMVKPITKYAVMVTSPAELRLELAKAWSIAMEGRKGPVLIDVPMDVQQAAIEGELLLPSPPKPTRPGPGVAAALAETLAAARRPVVLWGAGVAFAGMERQTLEWLDRSNLPFVSSWAGLSSFDHERANFVGQIGVYGNRGANFVLQNADTVIVLGSRLDNRQRSGNSANFAIGATVHVLDVDAEELKKYAADGYRTDEFDFAYLGDVLGELPGLTLDPAWTTYVSKMRGRYRGREESTSARRLNSSSPYDVVRKLNAAIAPDAVVVGDTGAAVCWLHQAFNVKAHRLFTAGGNSPMGYALPAAIGAKLEAPARQVVCYSGDGGFQLNLQELQTVRAQQLDLAIVVMNNASYGIIKQFQDSYLGSRYTASLDGYSTPDFGRIAGAYGLRYVRIESPDEIAPAVFEGGAVLIDVILSEDTLIEPKLEMGRPINDQFPYLPQAEYEDGNRFVAYPRPDAIRDLVS